jgi:hypothetical protein
MTPKPSGRKYNYLCSRDDSFYYERIWKKELYRIKLAANTWDGAAEQREKFEACMAIGQHALKPFDTSPGGARLWLAPIPRTLRTKAMEHFDAGEAEDFLCMAQSDRGLEIVHRNSDQLLKRGIYEAALLRAYGATNTNWANWSLKSLSALFERSNPKALRKAGPLPEGDSFTLYRGVAGDEPLRKEAGYSWTRSPSVAAWFANFLSHRTGTQLRDPAVLMTVAKAEDVLAYLNDRNEDDFVVLATDWKRVEPMPLPMRGEDDPVSEQVF